MNTNLDQLNTVTEIQHSKSKIYNHRYCKCFYLFV